MIYRFPRAKHPGEIERYGIQWHGILARRFAHGLVDELEEIQHSTWSVDDTTLTIDLPRITDATLATVRVSGGVAGTEYVLTNTITTGVETLIERIAIPVED